MLSVFGPYPSFSSSNPPIPLGFDRRFPASQLRTPKPMKPHRTTPVAANPLGVDPSIQQLPKRSMMAAILTDKHFWVPVVVLALGTLLLVILSRSP